MLLVRLESDRGAWAASGYRGCSDVGRPAQWVTSSSSALYALRPSALRPRERPRRSASRASRCRSCPSSRPEVGSAGRRSRAAWTVALQLSGPADVRPSGGLAVPTEDC